MGKFWVKNGKISGGKWENFRWRNLLGGKCLKQSHRKFGVPGNVILQKSPATVNNSSVGIDSVYFHSAIDYCATNETTCFNNGTCVSQHDLARFYCICPESTVPGEDIVGLRCENSKIHFSIVRLLTSIICFIGEIMLTSLISCWLMTYNVFCTNFFRTSFSFQSYYLVQRNV